MAINESTTTATEAEMLAVIRAATANAPAQQIQIGHRLRGELHALLDLLLLELEAAHESETLNCGVIGLRERLLRENRVAAIIGLLRGKTS